MADRPPFIVPKYGRRSLRPDAQLWPLRPWASAACSNRDGPAQPRKPTRWKRSTADETESRRAQTGCPGYRRGTYKNAYSRTTKSASGAETGTPPAPTENRSRPFRRPEDNSRRPPTRSSVAKRHGSKHTDGG